MSITLSKQLQHNWKQISISISGTAAGVYNDCKIHDNSGSVLISEQANPVLDCCEISNYCEKVSPSKTVHVVLSRIARLMEINMVVFMYKTALFHHSKDGTFKNCKIFENKGNGISLDFSADPLFEGCKIITNRKSGLYLQGSATGIFRNCNIFDNKTDGKD